MLIGIVGTVVAGCEVEGGALVVHVRPTGRRPRCSGCGRLRPSGAVATERRRWRHLDLAGIMLFLSYDIRRVSCPRCGVVVERVPWSSDVRARFTDDFDDHVAYLAQRCDKTSIETMLGIAWRSVGRCIERVMKRRGRADPLAGLSLIGVDEISYRKHHHYLTLVADHVERRIVWGKAGKDAGTLKAFFGDLGEERRQEIKGVSMDMSSAYMNAVRDTVPWAQIVFDRFHVEALATKALDETRRDLWQELRKDDPEAANMLKHSRWALLKKPMDLTEAQAAKLSEIQHGNARLYRAYLLKEQLGDILDRKQPNVVHALLLRWISWALHSRLPAFIRTAQTIREHLEEIVAYIRWRLTNGLIEGLNNKARLLTRRAYGFHSAEAVLAMIMLCCSGVEIPPPRKNLVA
jgi:transposase